MKIHIYSRLQNLTTVCPLNLGNKPQQPVISSDQDPPSGRISLAYMQTWTVRAAAYSTHYSSFAFPRFRLSPELLL